MVKHKPEQKHGVKIDGVIYRPNSKGELYLPVRLDQYNPEKEKKKKTDDKIID